MSVKIMIERKFQDQAGPEDLKTIDDIRIKALRQPGYIGGETVVNRDDPTEVVVISAWTGVEEWEAWLQNAERVELEDALASRLSAPAEIHAFVTAADYSIRVQA